MAHVVLIWVVYIETPYPKPLNPITPNHKPNSERHGSPWVGFRFRRYVAKYLYTHMSTYVRLYIPNMHVPIIVDVSTHHLAA